MIAHPRIAQLEAALEAVKGVVLAETKRADEAEATIERLMKRLDDSGIGTPVEIADRWDERGGK